MAVSSFGKIMMTTLPGTVLIQVVESTQLLLARTSLVVWYLVVYSQRQLSLLLVDY